jgi:CII-binding regulator of phage lambda lysogenization HflD
VKKRTQTKINTVNDYNDEDTVVFNYTENKLRTGMGSQINLRHPTKGSIINNALSTTTRYSRTTQISRLERDLKSE